MTGPADSSWSLPDGFAERYGPWALITGGSEGTGAAFARRLAEQGINLVLVARRRGPLDALAAEVASDHGVAVRTASVDLADLDAATRLAEVTSDLDVGMVLFNAGATTRWETFDDWPSADVAAMVAMNCYTVALAAHHFAPRMRARGRGAIVLIGSMAGFAGSSHHTVYNASKAFDWVLAEGLWKELGGDGVDALILVLGATDTPSHQRMGVDFGDQAVMDPDEVAVEGLANLQQGPVYIVGEHNRAIFDFVLTSDRASLVSAMSEASARIAPNRPRDSDDRRQ